MTPRRLDCGDARALLAARPDGSLDPRDEAVLEAHLGSCLSCAEEAAGLDRVDRILRAMETGDPGPAFTAAVVRRLDRAPGGDRVAARLPAMPGPDRILRGGIFAAGTVAVAALAAALLPGTPAAVALEGLLPGLPSVSLSGIPWAAGEGPPLPASLLPGWAAPAGALAAAAGLAIQLVSVRRRRGGPPS